MIDSPSVHQKRGLAETRNSQTSELRTLGHRPLLEYWCFALLAFYPEIDEKYLQLHSFFLNDSLLLVLMLLAKRKKVLFTSTNNLRKLWTGSKGQRGL